MDFAPFRFFFFKEKPSHAPSFLLFRLTCLRALSECALAGAEKTNSFLAKCALLRFSLQENILTLSCPSFFTRLSSCRRARHLIGRKKAKSFFNVRQILKKDRIKSCPFCYFSILLFRPLWSRRLWRRPLSRELRNPAHRRRFELSFPK